MHKIIKICLMASVFAWSAGIAHSAEETKKEDAAKVPEIQTSVTKHTGKFNGVTLKYTVSAGDTHLKNDKGEAVASIFSTAYTKDGVKNPAARPITFMFNGGPGSASLWLHMGVFGPKRIDVPSDAVNAGAAPYSLIDNPLSLLDVTDVVFIDPVGTGYSKVVGTGEGKDFWGLNEDAKSVAKFIQMYVTKNKRWNSPKYVGGESYGTTRTAALVKELQQGYNSMALNGLIMISSILDFQTTDGGSANDDPYVSFLPTFAATAWYHGKVDKTGTTLEAFVDEARNFAINEYSVALLKGNRMTDAERENILTKLSRYTGLSKGYLKQARLRVNEFRFMKELLRDEGKVVGRLDSRFTGTEEDDAGETFEADPSGYGISAAYTAAVNDYFGRTLNIEREERYEVLSGKPGKKWNWKQGQSWTGGYPALGHYVARGMRQNKDLRMYVANGYYDMATPFFGTEYTMAQYGLDQNRITMDYFEAGHMMYLHHPSLEKLAKNVRQFILDGAK
ncbi:S10 family peptidase [Paremcibacter congregatus]|uniref:S10 family peptidase n=1 Tax=Paremcibacter congregatus TaxID=2043170 RepID=UPI0030EEA7CD|tara:strand:- start:6718 stop:8235 length:1518 start_codon:yes stop_codon:yes gene_type:complete